MGGGEPSKGKGGGKGGGKAAWQAFGRGGRQPSGKGGSGGSKVGRWRSWPCVVALESVPHGTSLIGDAAAFCDAFYHVRDTREAGLPLCCLRHPAECEGRHTVIVARLCDCSGAVLHVGEMSS